MDSFPRWLCFPFPPNNEHYFLRLVHLLLPRLVLYVSCPSFQMVLLPFRQTRNEGLLFCQDVFACPSRAFGNPYVGETRLLARNLKQLGIHTFNTFLFVVSPGYAQTLATEVFPILISISYLIEFPTLFSLLALNMLFPLTQSQLTIAHGEDFGRFRLSVSRTLAARRT